MASTTSTGTSLPPLPTQRLLGRVALVTGGSNGIGESIVRMFHRHGAKVCIVDIQDDLGKQVCESLGDGPNISYCHCDVTIEDDVKRAVDIVEEKFGSLDIIVNNAGITRPPCSDINVKGVFIGMKHAARAMIPEKKGSIISICSVAGSIGGVGPHAYVGSKHAVLGLTKNVASELGKHGIRVNCISPYAVATDLALAHLPEDERTEDAWVGF